MDYSSDEEIIVKKDALGRRKPITTNKEVVIKGLELGKSRSIEVRDTPEKGRSVFATEFIPKSSYVCEYKYDKLYPASERLKYEKEYELNEEGSYVLEVYIDGRKMCVDATRRLYSFGRYINHGVDANVRPFPPVFVRGKYRVGFITIKDVSEEEELTWDYGQQRKAPQWLHRKPRNRSSLCSSGWSSMTESRSSQSETGMFSKVLSLKLDRIKFESRSPSKSPVACCHSTRVLAAPCHHSTPALGAPCCRSTPALLLSSDDNTDDDDDDEEVLNNTTKRIRRVSDVYTDSEECTSKEAATSSFTGSLSHGSPEEPTSQPRDVCMGQLGQTSTEESTDSEEDQDCMDSEEGRECTSIPESTVSETDAEEQTRKEHNVDTHGEEGQEHTSITEEEPSLIGRIVDGCMDGEESQEYASVKEARLCVIRRERDGCIGSKEGQETTLIMEASESCASNTVSNRTHIELQVPSLAKMCCRVLAGKKSVLHQPGYIPAKMQELSTLEPHSVLHHQPGYKPAKTQQLPTVSSLEPHASHQHPYVSETGMPGSTDEDMMEMEDIPCAQACKRDERLLSPLDTTVTSTSVVCESRDGDFSGMKERDRHTKYKLCPVPKCTAKPQKRIADHIRLSHPSLSPKKRRIFCKIAKPVKKNFIKPQGKGQRKLSFSKLHETSDDDIVVPKFQEQEEEVVKISLPVKKAGGGGGTTRDLGSFLATNPKLVDFRKFLRSIEGAEKSGNVAKQISADVSKLLYFINPSELKWKSLVNKSALLQYFEKLKDLDIGCEGRLTKMERVGDALKYIKFCLHGKHDSQTVKFLQDISSTESSLTQWKTILRREKKKIAALRLERDSRELPGLDVVSKVVDNPMLKTKFSEVVRAVEEGQTPTDDDLKIAVCAVAYPAMLQSAARPGSIQNMTVKEFEEGTMVDNVYVVSVSSHKTSLTTGTCKIMFTREIYARARNYASLIRPLLDEHEDNAFFLVPGGVPVSKFCNLTRFLSNKLGVSVPSSTAVRKITTTAVARSCSRDKLDLVTKQLNHNTKTSEKYYQCIHSSRDATDVFHTVEKLRNDQKKCGYSLNRTWSAEESEIVYCHFKDIIKPGAKGPTLKQCRILVPKLPGRDSKGIQDKTRTFIRQLERKEDN